jgi:beta-phosphoglucomutase
MHAFDMVARGLARRPPRGLVFDMDGTIIDTRPFHMAAWRTMVHDLKLPQRCFELAESGFGKTNWLIFQEWYGPGADSSGWDELSQVKEALFRKLIHGHAIARPGFHELLAFARSRGIRIALATSGPRENAEFLLAELGVRRLFDVVVFGDAAIRSKPHPEPFLRAAQRLGLPPQHCFGFEDSSFGFLSVLRANMPLVAIAERHDDLSKLKRWTGLVFQDFRPLVPLLKQLHAAPHAVA